QRNFHAKLLAHARGESRREERLQAEVEEALPKADGIDAQHLLNDCAELLLFGRARSLVEREIDRGVECVHRRVEHLRMAYVEGLFEVRRAAFEALDLSARGLRNAAGL